MKTHYLLNEEQLTEIVRGAVMTLLKEYFAVELKEMLRRIEHYIPEFAVHWCLCKNVQNKLDYGVRLDWELNDDTAYQYQFSLVELQNYEHWKDEATNFLRSMKPPKTKDGKTDHTQVVYNLLTNKLKLNNPNVIYNIIENELIGKQYRDREVIMNLAKEFSNYATSTQPGENLAEHIGNASVNPEQCTYQRFQEIPGMPPRRRNV